MCSSRSSATRLSSLPGPPRDALAAFRGRLRRGLGHAARIARVLGTAKRRLGQEVGIFDPHDGYASMTQFFLAAFQWHGVKRGDAFAFYAGDIWVEGPHPLCSQRRQSAERAHPGRVPCTPTGIEQLRGTAARGRSGSGQRLRWGAFTTPSSGGWIMFRQIPAAEGSVTLEVAASGGRSRPTRGASVKAASFFMTYCNAR